MYIKKIFLSVALLILAPFSVANAENYEIDDYQKGAHAFIQFKVSHLGYSYIIGTFDQFTGNFFYDENNPDTSNVKVEIQTDSIDTSHAERDQHLRNADFFDAPKYPTITFESTSFSEQANGDVTITGNLNLHGVEKSVTLQGRHVGHGDDPWGNYRRGLEASVDLNVSEFGFPSWLGTVEIYVVVEGIRS